METRLLPAACLLLAPTTYKASTELLTTCLLNQSQEQSVVLQVCLG